MHTLIRAFAFSRGRGRGKKEKNERKGKNYIEKEEAYSRESVADLCRASFPFAGRFFAKVIKAAAKYIFGFVPLSLLLITSPEFPPAL